MARLAGTITEEQRQLLAALSMTPAQRARRVKELEAGAPPANDAQTTDDETVDRAGSD